MVSPNSYIESIACTNEIVDVSHKKIKESTTEPCDILIYIVICVDYAHFYNSN